MGQVENFGFIFKADLKETTELDRRDLALHVIPKTCGSDSEGSAFSGFLVLELFTDVCWRIPGCVQVRKGVRKSVMQSGSNCKKCFKRNQVKIYFYHIRVSNVQIIK